jgi:signal transduction histidine kinase
MLYGGLFLVAGAALLAITYGLVAGGTAMTSSKSVLITRKAGTTQQLPAFPANAIGAVATPVKGPPSGASQPGVGEQGPGTVEVPPAGQAAVVQLLAYAGKVTAVFKRLNTTQAAQLRAQQQSADARYEELRSTQLDTLLTRSGLALAIMALASIGLGWLMAGRALRPVRTMSSRARGISERNLHERLALDGPDDELKELGDTFDGLLGRLEAAFESQRRFVANASHELRTPITLERALVEVALSDPNPSVESLRDTCGRVLTASEQQERLIEALLTLARSQRGLESRATVDLREVTGEAVRAVPSNGIRVETDLGDASTTGDPAMVERLVVNLMQNAIRYNEPDGWVAAWTGMRDGEPTVEVTNPGPVVNPEQVGELVKPFSRLDRNGSVAARNADAEQGLGLGLSIVQAIVDAHGARLTTDPRPQGGLKVAVSFPALE